MQSKGTLVTGGKDYHQHTFNPRAITLHPGDEAIRTAFKKVFGVRSFLRWPDVVCFMDTLEGGGMQNHYQSLDGVLFMGCLYDCCEGGIDIGSHFFIRKFVNCRGPLDCWRNDVVFPLGTKKFSVCAIYPEGYEVPKQGVGDPHNHAVTNFTWERMLELGVDMTTLIDRMSAPEFAVDN